MRYEECSDNAYHLLQVLTTSNQCSTNAEMSTVEFLEPYTHRNVQVLDYVLVPTMTFKFLQVSFSYCSYIWSPQQIKIIFL
jgi:hypothetical protein